MFTLMLILATSIPGALLFLVLVAILRAMPEAETSPTSVQMPQTAPDGAQADRRLGASAGQAG